ncbi:MAG: PAS domain-containing sensor histidine kinase [Candidatus Parcubacteria bacterium]|nr:PAS domain-containing sensor histidine kinase [Candidatus Parcubacteria bacterium]
MASAINGKKIKALQRQSDLQEKSVINDSLANFYNATEHSFSGIFILDNDFNIIYLNEAAAKNHGYAREKIGIKNFFDLINCQSNNKQNKILARLQKGEWIGKIKIDGASGDRMKYEIYINKIQQIGNGRQSFLAIENQILDSTKTEEKLRQSEERFRIIFENAPETIYLNDLKGTFIAGNRASEILTGYKRNELIGKSFLKLKLISPQQILKAAELLAANALGKPTGPNEFKLRRKDGATVIVEISTYPVKLNDKTTILGIARDISERKSMENKLAESEAKYRSLVEETSDIIYSADLDGNLTYISPQIAKLGYRPKELIGKNFLQFIHQSDRNKVINDFKKTITTGQELPTQFRLISDNKKNNYRWVEETDKVIRNRQNNIVGVTGIVRDITERKIIEKQLAKLNNELDRKVEQRTRQLKIALTELKSLDALKDEFLNISAHELKTPLTSIIGLTELMILKKQGSINNQQEKSLQIVNNESNRLLNIIKKILNITRIEAKKAVFDLQLLNPCDLLPKVVESLKTIAKGLEVKIICQRPHGKFLVKADPEKLQEVVYNLIDNALKFSPPNSKVLVSGEIKDKNFIFSVKDQGHGIDPASKKRLFQKFSQLDTGFSRQQEGTGLGLYISKIMIDSMGGKIWVESELGKGATFIFSLPIAKKKKNAG